MDIPRGTPLPCRGGVGGGVSNLTVINLTIPSPFSLSFSPLSNGVEKKNIRCDEKKE